MRSELYEWRPVVGYEGLYEVNNLGEVRSLDRIDSMGRLKRGQILKLKHNPSGYLQIALHIDGVSYYYWVHRLVAQAFIPNPSNLPQVNHKDEDKTNNRASNLEWCNQSYNMLYNGLSQRIAVKQRNNRQSKPVDQYDMDGNLLKTWPSMNEIRRELGFNTGDISNCCQGKNHIKTVGGFIWRFSDTKKAVD